MFVDNSSVHGSKAGDLLCDGTLQDSPPDVNIPGAEKSLRYLLPKCTEHFGGIKDGVVLLTI